MKKYLRELVANIRSGRARKLVVYVCGIAAQVAAAGILPEPEQSYVMSGLALATALGIYQARNRQAP